MAKNQKTPPLKKVFIFIISVVFLSQFFTNNLRIKILNIFRIPLKLISGSFYVLRDVTDFKELREENKFLKGEAVNLKKSVLELKETALENNRLRELLEFREHAQRKVVPAFVIGRDPSFLRDTIIIDRGKRHNIRKDMVVISGNSLVGRVRECGFSISRVMLITDRDFAVSALVQRTRDEGVVAGNMREGLLMKYLDKGCEVKKGDEVITSGMGGVFDKGILIGKVVSLEEDPSSLYTNAIIKPDVDVRRMEEVLLLR